MRVAVLGALACVIAPSAWAADPGDREPDSAGRLGDVVVTAQKRGEERLLDVPVAITAIATEALTDSGQVLLSDYYDRVPGLTLTPGAQSAQVLSLRGVGAFSGSQTVGILVDDLPFGSSGRDTGTVVPDFDPGELQRIEVLRGPQGTLFGAGAMGGLLRFITRDPSPAVLSGKLQAGVDSVYHGDGLGSSLRGSINVPIGDTIALRADGFTRRDSGYIDNPITDRKGINHVRASGGYLALGWTPDSHWKVRLSALYQQSEGAGTNDSSLVAQPIWGALPPLGPLQQDYIASVGPYVRSAAVLGAVVNYDAGSIHVVSSSSYSKNTYHDLFDASIAASPISEFFYGVAGTPIDNRGEIKRYTQEVRVSFPLTKRLDAMVGAFFTNERTVFAQGVLAADPLSASFAGSILAIRNPQTFREASLFTNETLHATDRLDIQIGLRGTRIHQSYQPIATGIAVPLFYPGEPDPFVAPDTRTSDSAATYLFTPSYKLAPDTLAYLRLASGYRAGGPNTVLSAGLPISYRPDKTYNYEVGVKSELLERRVALDVAAYYIDWKNIALQLFDTGTQSSYTGNAGSAKSQGLELTARWKPTPRLTIAGWIDLAEATLTADFPVAAVAGGTAGLAGDPLPWSPRFSGNLSFDYEWPIRPGLTAVVGATEAYLGERKDGFSSPDANGNPTPRQILPAYAKLDLRAGARWGDWAVNTYVNNAADRRGVIGGGPGSYPPGSTYFIHPRTIGMTLSRSF